MKWTFKEYKELTLNEFHAILKLRIDVFIVEQNCPYSELDNKDKLAFHLFAFAEENPDEIIAYTRIFKPGDYYKQAALGRVVVHPDYRKKNLGRILIQETIQKIDEHFNTTTIKIGAQTYLQKFYESFQFEQDGDAYIEDGIPHIHMIRN